MDHRYEWVTIDSLNTTMMRYLGKAGSGKKMPIDMTGSENLPGRDRESVNAT
jgi:hypothetical protein